MNVKALHSLTISRIRTVTILFCSLVRTSASS